jgi:hypothetical protein
MSVAPNQHAPLERNDAVSSAGDTGAPAFRDRVPLEFAREHLLIGDGIGEDGAERLRVSCRRP